MAALYLDDKVIYFRKRKDSPFYFFSLDQGTHWKTTKQTTPTAARKWVQERYGTGKRAVAFAGPKLKDYLIEAFDKYVADKKAVGNPLGDSYVKLSRSYLKRFVLTDPIIAEKKIGDIRLGDFEDFQTRLLEERLPGKKTTAKRVLEIFRLLMRRAYRRGEISRNPTDGVIPVKVKKKARAIYELEELEKLFPRDVWSKQDFNPWQGPDDYTAFITAAATGMRRSEILALRWSAVDLDRGIVDIRSALKGAIEGLPKSGRPRATPIFDEVLWPDRRALEALKNLKRLQASRRIQVIDPPVFGYLDGSFRKATWWTKRLKAALEKAGINRDKGQNIMSLDAHSLRHTLAIHLKGRGVSDGLIRQFCSWSSMHVQANYMHIEADVLQSVMEKIRLSGTK